MSKPYIYLIGWDELTDVDLMAMHMFAQGEVKGGVGSMRTKDDSKVGLCDVYNPDWNANHPCRGCPFDTVRDNNTSTTTDDSLCYLYNNNNVKPLEILELVEHEVSKRNRRTKIS